MFWKCNMTQVINEVVSARRQICGTGMNSSSSPVASNLIALWEGRFNSSPPSAVYMRQWTGSALGQIMACRLGGAEPLSEPMLEYY